MDPGEQSTGTRDEQYNLVSVLYHALHGAETIEAYVLDAEAAGDDRLAGFFREAQATYRQLAEQAKGRLGVLEVPPGPEVAPDAPPEGGISPGAMAGGIPPEPVDAEPGGAAPPLDTAAPVGATPDVPPRGGVPPEGRMPPGGRTPPGGEVPPDAALEDVPPREAGVPPDAALGDVPPREADVRLEPDVRAEEVDVPPTEGIPPTTDVPRTPPDAALPPEEDVVVEPEGAPPGDVLQRGTTPEAPPRDVPPAGVPEDVEGGVAPGRAPDMPPPGGAAGEPSLATPEERATTQPEEEEEKGLIDKAKDKLTEAKDRLTGESDDRTRDRR
ncbi:MAG: hypothetical protein M3N18_01910 [Actinomycetota bacterium]|nr:hypothetical protein [Actinomycetota bacterium]